jgi:hypothetical protein
MLLIDIQYGYGKRSAARVCCVLRMWISGARYKQIGSHLDRSAEGRRNKARTMMNDSTRDSTRVFLLGLPVCLLFVLCLSIWLWWFFYLYLD